VRTKASEYETEKGILKLLMQENATNVEITGKVKAASCINTGVSQASNEQGHKLMCLHTGKKMKGLGKYLEKELMGGSRVV